MDEKLIRFVDHAREQRMDYATIRQLLVSAGWNSSAAKVKRRGATMARGGVRY